MELSHAALIVIDMQRGFLDAESPLCIKNAAATVPACAAAIKAARRLAVPVFYVSRAYRTDGSDVEHTRRAVWEAGGRPLIPGSTGPCSAEIPAEMAPAPGDYQLIKPRFSAFFATELDLILRRLNINTILLAGTTTPNCIRTTCYDGISLDYQVGVITDCCSSNDDDIQQSNLRDMKNIGALMLDSAELVKMAEEIR